MAIGSDYYPGGMLEPGRQFTAAGGTQYRYGFNGMENDNDVSNGAYTTEFREFDSRIGRWLSFDPKSKVQESPYAWNSNNPIWTMDPSGADSIFYNQSGNEIRRVKMAGDHTYFLLHQNGNLTINGSKYYQGYSYHSFFGDVDKFAGPTMFTNVNGVLFPKLDIATVEKFVHKRYTGQGYRTFWTNSGYQGTFDYKNMGEFGKTGDETVYLISGMIYNRHEMGMVLWGAAEALTGTDYSTLAAWNALIHIHIEGNGDEWNEVKAWTTGYYMERYKSMNTQNIGKLVDAYYNQSSSQNNSYLIHIRGVDPTSADGFRELYKGQKGYYNDHNSNWFEDKATMGVLYLWGAFGAFGASPAGTIHKTDQEILNSNYQPIDK